MRATDTVSTTVDPEAATLVAELGMQKELEQMLEHARQTIPGLQSLRVRFAPAYDTGEEGIIIEAIRDLAYDKRDDPARHKWRSWEIATFSPDVLRYFTLLIAYGTSHAG